MKKKYCKLLSLLLCSLLLIGSAGAACAQGEEHLLNKKETVYVFAGADGSAEKMIVSDWIENAGGCASISDQSELTDVETVKGDATYVMDGDTIRVWDAQGKDIYYQGTIQKALPVDLSVSYTLDGERISPEELAGKSGKVTIRFDYTNNESKTVELDGRQETLFVPFAMLTGVVLDAERFTNVTVSNGKLINDGSRIAVIGMAFPGLQSNLNIDAEQLEIPDYVEITADVTDFALTNTVTVATNEIFSRLPTEKLNSADELSASLGELTDAMGQLIDGDSQLYDGLCTLLEKSEELVSGVNQLADGAMQLKNGSAALNDGGAELSGGAEALANGAASLAEGTAQLEDGARTLAEGLDTLAANNDTLGSGAKQIFASLLKMADSQLAAAGLTVPELTEDNYAQVLGGVIVGLEAVSPSGAASIRALKEQLDSYNQFYMGLNQYTAGVASAREGANQLYAGACQINEGAAQLHSGSSQLRDGADALKAGAAELDAGMGGLYEGICTLENGGSALVEGVTQLREGSKELSDGLKEFNENGVQKLVAAVDGDISGLITRVKATVDVSKAYPSFSGISEGMGGQVAFLYRTEAIDAK